MSAPSYLLDTDTFVYIRRGRPEQARTRFRRLRPGQAVLSVITYGELLYGIKKKQVGAAPLQQLAELVSLIEVLPLPRDAADFYGTIRSAMALKGELIGSNDLWIAAHALSAGLTLVTNNVSEFRRVAGLKIENWVA